MQSAYGKGRVNYHQNLMDNFQNTHEECVQNRNARRTRQQPQIQPHPADQEHHCVQLERICQEQHLQQQAIAQEKIRQQVQAHAAIEHEQVCQQIEEKEATQVQQNREQNEQQL